MGKLTTACIDKKTFKKVQMRAITSETTYTKQTTLLVEIGLYFRDRHDLNSIEDLEKLKKVFRDKI